MIAEIEDAIIAEVTAKIAPADGITVYCYLNSGSFERVTSETYRQTANGVVGMIFRDIGTESQRRLGVYPILEAIISYLLHQTLALDIKPLSLKSWKDITPEEYREQGLLVFELEVETSYHLRKLDDEVLQELLRVGLNYYLQDPTDDDVADATDLLERPLPFMAGVNSAGERIYEEDLPLGIPPDE